MPNPQAFIKQIEESIGIEEASLVKELGPTTGTGKSLIDAQARTQRGHRLDRRALAGGAGGALVLRREGRDASRQIPTVAVGWLSSAGATQLRLLQQGTAAVGAAGRDHHADHALLRHRQQVQPRRQLPVSRGVPRQSRVDRDDRQGRDPSLAALERSRPHVRDTCTLVGKTLYVRDRKMIMAARRIERP